MRHESLDERFRVDVGRADNGQTFVRVVDVVTGRHREQIGLYGESTNAIATRLANEIGQELPKDTRSS